MLLPCIIVNVGLEKDLRGSESLLTRPAALPWHGVLENFRGEVATR